MKKAPRGNGNAKKIYIERKSLPKSGGSGMARKGAN